MWQQEFIWFFAIFHADGGMNLVPSEHLDEFPGMTYCHT
jgi:hypothetical protein